MRIRSLFVGLTNRLRIDWLLEQDKAADDGALRAEYEPAHPFGAKPVAEIPRQRRLRRARRPGADHPAHAGEGVEGATGTSVTISPISTDRRALLHAGLDLALRVTLW
jgi:hypothetical protein